MLVNIYFSPYFLRVLKREERVKKSLSTQNRIVDEEVDRFQNHIRSLRKMNQRLERIAFPAVKKKPNKINYGFLKSPYCMSSGLSIEKVSGDQVQQLEERALRKKLQSRILVKKVMKHTNTLNEVISPLLVIRWMGMILFCINLWPSLKLHLNTRTQYLRRSTRDILSQKGIEFERWNISH